VFRNCSTSRRVVGSNLSFDADRIARIEDRTVGEVEMQLLKFVVQKLPPNENPADERVLEFGIGVRVHPG
jgi:hypothetical protein